MRVLRWLWVPGVVVVTLAIASAIWVHTAPITRAHLSASVADGVGGFSFGGECRRAGRAWRCVIDDAEGSGNASTYVVRVRGRRCWTATRTAGSFVNRKLKPRAKGCVGFWDRVTSIVM